MSISCVTKYVLDVWGMLEVISELLTLEYDAAIVVISPPVTALSAVALYRRAYPVSADVFMVAS